MITWAIGKCDRCSEPRGDYAACVFKVRVMARFLSWRWRAWRWWCDDCTAFRDRMKRDRVKRAQLRRWRAGALRALANSMGVSFADISKSFDNQTDAPAVTGANNEKESAGMAKFKKGDRVRMVDVGGNNDMESAREPLRNGMIGTVLGDYYHPDVEWDGYVGGHNGPFGDFRRSCWAVDEGCIELLLQPGEEATLLGDEVHFTTTADGRRYRLVREGVGWRCYSVPDEGYRSLWSNFSVNDAFSSGVWKLAEQPTDAEQLLQELREAGRECDAARAARMDADRVSAEANKRLAAARERYEAALAAIEGAVKVVDVAG